MVLLRVFVKFLFYEQQCKAKSSNFVILKRVTLNRVSLNGVYVLFYKNNNTL